MQRIFKKIILSSLIASLLVPTAPVYADNETYIVDAVQIHTPVMSPGTIYTGDGSPANKEERGSEIPTSLVQDVSKPDTANLRLDQFYYIKWKDLSELGSGYESRDKKHRDGQDEDNSAATPEMGGYVDQTDDKDTDVLEEDQFTRNKYMKFPFEVFYEGNFYKANQWIRIKKPPETESHSEDGDHYFSGWSRDPNPHVNADGSLSSDNHWVYTPFYIPTWAREGLFEDIEVPADHRYEPAELDTCVQLRVEAINSEGDTEAGGHNRAEQLQKIANTYYNISVGTYDDGAAYAAIFNMPVQVSGWIYGFTITGTSEYDTFASQSVQNLTSNKVGNHVDYSFTANKQDKKAGVLNRLGWPALRFAKDGTIAKTGGTAKWDPINTIALDGAWKDTSGKIHYGKSNAFKYMGTIPKGTTFSFTLKTMSNMWNFNGKDEIKITPTFTYRRFDTTSNKWISRENKDLKVYYTYDGETYIPYGSDKDRAFIQEANLGNKQFDQSYYTEEDTNSANGRRYGDWVNYSVYQHDKRYNLFSHRNMTLDEFKQAVKSGSKMIGDSAMTPQMWLSKKYPIYCLSKITIPEGLRLLSGEADQLKINNYKNGYDITDVSYSKHGGFDTYQGWADDFYHEFTGRFEDGEYDDVYPEAPDMVINGTRVAVTSEDKFRHSIQSWYGKYYMPEDLYVVDLKEHPEFRDFDDPESPYYGSEAADGSVLMPDGKRYFDYLEYYATNDYRDSDGLTENEEIFLPNGFLCVNFDIIAVKQGEDHLRYNGFNGGEWGAEGYQKVPDSPDITPPEPGTTEDGVPTITGDTVVVDLSKKYSDRYRTGLYNIN